jgi:hypothetical protein
MPRRRSRWSSFLADPGEERPGTRRFLVAQARRQLDAAQDAYARLYAERR